MSLNHHTCLGIAGDQLLARGGADTAREIAQQPEVWQQLHAMLAQRSAEIGAFFAPLLAQPDLRIILTGAGTSAFIGKCLAPQLLARTGRRVEAIPTTDLVAGPALYLQPDAPTLLVSFARSGSSPESVAAVDLANSFCHTIHHVIVTCNAGGELYVRCRDADNALTLLLPEATHDRGFAMTSSFTSMLYAASLAFGLVAGDEPACVNMAQAGQHVLHQALPLLNQLVDADYDRVVYLGSNGLRGLAEEAALKLLELTDGATVAAFDSPLGFRHGPKTIVNDRTLVIVMLSNDAHTRQYDLDLLGELRRDGRAGRVVALSGRDDIGSAPDNFLLDGMADADDLELALPFVMFAQMFAFLRSLSVGNTPDRPSRSGTVNRVVQGVIIYPVATEVKHVSGH